MVKLELLNACDQPVRYGYTGGNFGDSRPNGRKHGGNDFAPAIPGDPSKHRILAVSNWIIDKIGQNSLSGIYVRTRHPEWNEVLYYCHLSYVANDLVIGKVRKEGLAIGHMGNTGSSTGKHLHLEWQVNGTPKDSMAFIHVIKPSEPTPTPPEQDCCIELSKDIDELNTEITKLKIILGGWASS